MLTCLGQPSSWPPNQDDWTGPAMCITPAACTGATCTGNLPRACRRRWKEKHSRPAPPPRYTEPARFRAQGGFDERFFCFSEDVDLGFRIRLAGGRCLQVAGAVAHHLGSGSAGRRSDFSVSHGFRNRFWTFVKNMPGPLFWPLLPAHIVATSGMLVLAAARGRGGPAWRGLKEARAGLGAVWQARRQIQRSRQASVWQIARALAWSPSPLFRRGLRGPGK